MLTVLAVEVAGDAVGVEVGSQYHPVSVQKLQQVVAFGCGGSAGQLGFEGAEIREGFLY